MLPIVSRRRAEPPPEDGVILLVLFSIERRDGRQSDGLILEATDSSSIFEVRPMGPRGTRPMGCAMMAELGRAHALG